MKTLLRLVTAVLLINSGIAEGFDGTDLNTPFISISASPSVSANMSAELNRNQYSTQASNKYDLDVSDIYGVRLSAWNFYLAASRASTQLGDYSPSGSYTAVSAGFLSDESDNSNYPVGFYRRFGAGFGSGKLRYADHHLNEDNLLWEFFVEGGLTFDHNYQLGMQVKRQGLFKMGDTRASMYDAGFVISLHF